MKHNLSLSRKNILKTLSAALLAVAATACSDVEPADRFIPVDGEEPQRAVLLEDYTGQNCINCPGAHEVIDLLVEQYPGAVIPVSIHAGNFGVSTARTSYERGYVGLMQPEGTPMADAWGINSFPMGVIDRRGTPQESDSWAAAVRDRISVPSVLEIEGEASTDPAASRLDISLVFKPAEDVKGTLHIWVVEDGIVAFQRNGSTRVPDYVHNNVYRASVNTLEGEPIDLEAHVHSSLTRSIEIRNTDTERWNPDRLRVVAFVQDAAGVVQAMQAPASKTLE